MSLSEFLDELDLTRHINTTRISSLTSGSGLGSISDADINVNPIFEITANSLLINATIQNITLSSILSELETQIFDKQDRTELITNYDNRNQTDSLFQGRANANNVYSIAQVDGFLLQKANTYDLDVKVSGSDVYLRFEADLTFQTNQIWIITSVLVIW